MVFALAGDSTMTTCILVSGEGPTGGAAPTRMIWGLASGGGKRCR